MLNGDKIISKDALPKVKEYAFVLFVTGATPNSTKAIANLKDICDTHLRGKYSLEIIDVYQQVALAREQQIIALPLLVKKMPLPERRLIGDLSDKEKVLKSLNIAF